MSLQKLINNYASFNLWANTKICDWLLSIEEDLLTKQVPSSFNNMNSSIQHICGVQKFWSEFISNKDVSNFDWSESESTAQGNLLKLKAQSIDMEKLFLTFTEEELLEELELKMPWAKNKLSRYEYMIHAINHSTYHRGQVVTMARVLGISENIPSTDYNFFNCK
jgi:uncharacterized damage-inducible protein DinB